MSRPDVERPIKKDRPERVLSLAAAFSGMMRARVSAALFHPSSRRPNVVGP